MGYLFQRLGERAIAFGAHLLHFTQPGFIFGKRFGDGAEDGFQIGLILGFRFGETLFGTRDQLALRLFQHAPGQRLETGVQFLQLTGMRLLAFVALRLQGSDLHRRFGDLRAALVGFAPGLVTLGRQCRHRPVSKHPAPNQAGNQGNNSNDGFGHGQIQQENRNEP